MIARWGRLMVVVPLLVTACAPLADPDLRARAAPLSDVLFVQAGDAIAALEASSGVTPPPKTLM